MTKFTGTNKALEKENLKAIANATGNNILPIAIMEHNILEVVQNFIDDFVGDNFLEPIETFYEGYLESDLPDSDTAHERCNNYFNFKIVRNLLKSINVNSVEGNEQIIIEAAKEYQEYMDGKEGSELVELFYSGYLETKTSELDRGNERSAYYFNLKIIMKLLDTISKNDLLKVSLS